jgi:transposase
VDRRDESCLLRYGITEVFVESEQSHRLKALLLARDQLVKMKRRLYGEIRGVLRPFGIRLPARAGTRRFDAAARAACREDDVLHGCVHALPEALGAIEAQLAALEERVRISTRSDETAWRLMSVPGVGPVTALAFQAAIEDPDRFRRSRDVGACPGLTPRRYPSGERDVTGHISRQGDAMARHDLYEAANCLLTTWSGRSALKSRGLSLARRIGARRARVAVARKRACLLLRLCKDGNHDQEEMRMA